MCSERGCKKAGSSRTVSPPSDKKVICWRGQNALGFEYAAQPTLGLFINPAHESENLRNTFFRYALAGDDLKATLPAGRAIASPNIPTVKSHRDRGAGFR